MISGEHHRVITLGVITVPFSYIFMSLASYLPHRPSLALSCILTVFHCFLLPNIFLVLLYHKYYKLQRVLFMRRCFLPYTPSPLPRMHCNNLLWSRFPWQLAVLLYRSEGFPLWFKTLTQSICLFESHSAQQTCNQ